jgi:hypothetical protein
MALGRKERLAMNRRTLSFAIALAVAVVVAVLVAALGGRTGGPSSASAAVSRYGTPVKLDTRMMPQASNPVVRAWLMARRARTAFYRLLRSNGDSCYAMGPAGTAKGPPSSFPHTISAFKCSARFPDGQPILDLSVIGADKPDTTLHVIALRGFAADGVASVAAVDAAGTVVARARVVNNVYMLKLADNAAHAGFVQAYDSAGNPLGGRQ